VTDNDKVQESISLASEKPPMYKLPRYPLEQIAHILEFGDKKHSASRNLGIGSNYWVSKALRHIFAWKEGEDLDEETGRSHIAHAATDLLCLLNEIIEHPECDDREVHHGN